MLKVWSRVKSLYCLSWLLRIILSEDVSGYGMDVLHAHL